MPITIIATPGSATANSYLDVAAASALLAYRFGTDAWDNAASGDKEKALALATVNIDAVRMRGIKLTYAQALQFPRTGQLEAWDQIPKDVQQACAVEALWLLQHKADGGKSERQQLQAEGVKSFRVGNFQETLSQGFAASSALSGEAAKFLQGWTSRTGQIIGPREEPALPQPWFGSPFAGYGYVPE